jgi:hypothetical protein
MSSIKHVVLLLGALSSPALADNTVGTEADEVNIWGDKDDIETHKPAVNLVDRDSHVDVHLGEVEGGHVAVEKDRRWLAPGPGGEFRGKRKVKDTYTVTPSWPSPNSTSQQVKVHFTWVGYRAPRRWESGEMRINFRRNQPGTPMAKPGSVRAP